MNEMKDYVLGRMLFDPTLDDAALIAEFLDGYYGAAAPYLMEYMQTMHDSVVRENFYLNFAWGPDAAFLTPAAILTSAEAFANGMAAVKDDPDPKHLDHVQSSAMSVYLLMMPRWNELTQFAQNNSIAWPLPEPTAEDAFRTFSKYFTATGARYGGALPYFSEGAGPGNLTKLHNQLFPKPAPCPKSWARADPAGQCAPTCNAAPTAASPTGRNGLATVGSKARVHSHTRLREVSAPHVGTAVPAQRPSVLATAVIPSNASASTWYKHVPYTNGAWTADGFAPQWISLSDFPSSGKGVAEAGAGMQLAGILAVVSQDPSGITNHTLAVNGKDVAVWKGLTVAGQSLSWTPSAASPAPAGDLTSVKISTTASPSWVGWTTITVYQCPQ